MLIPLPRPACASTQAHPQEAAARRSRRRPPGLAPQGSRRGWAAAPGLGRGAAAEPRLRLARGANRVAPAGRRLRRLRAEIEQLVSHSSYTNPDEPILTSQSAHERSTGRMPASPCGSPPRLVRRHLKACGAGQPRKHAAACRCSLRSTRDALSGRVGSTGGAQRRAARGPALGLSLGGSFGAAFLASQLVTGEWREAYVERGW